MKTVIAKSFGVAFAVLIRKIAIGVPIYSVFYHRLFCIGQRLFIVAELNRYQKATKSIIPVSRSAEVINQKTRRKCDTLLHTWRGSTCLTCKLFSRAQPYFKSQAIDMVNRVI